MAQINTTKTINATQLAEEIGETAVSIVEADGGSFDVRASKEGLTNVALQSAVDAHRPRPWTPGDAALQA